MKKLGMLDVKQAVLNDSRFRELFPEMKEDFIKVLNNPSCACNTPTYQKLLKYPDRLKEYFPDKIIKSIDEEKEELAQNSWSVINCTTDQLEDILNSIHKVGRKQISIARYNDQLTVVINDIGVIY